VLDLIRALEASHQAMDRYSRAPVAAARTLRTLPPEILAAGAADKIVALRALLIRAERAPDRTGFWHHRHAFVRHVPYFRTFATAVAAALPGRLADELDALVTAAERQTR
jgi:hypothetical protein